MSCGQVCVKPGRRKTRWIKSVKPGPSHDTDGIAAQCSLKVIICLSVYKP